MEVISHMCDICKETKSKEDLVQLSLSQRDKWSAKTKLIDDIKFDVCPDCLKKKGIIINRLEGMSEAELCSRNKKSFEDKFIELLDDLGVTFGEL